MTDRRFLLWGVPLLSLFILVLIDGSRAFSSLAVFAVDLGVTFLFTLVLWLGTRELWARLWRRFPTVDQTVRRLWWLVTAGLLYTSGATVLLVAFLRLFLPNYFSLAPKALLAQIVFNLLPTTVVLLIYESRHFFRQWVANVRRAEQLKGAHAQSQLAALQQQLDPHFLFNSLNTLAALVEPGNVPAQQFVEQLADVYRYVLLSRDRPTVLLAEELAFVETYLALHKARFRANLQVALHVPPAALAYRVAPLSVQLLVENALKHNVASREHPLTLTLTADPVAGYLTVQNSRRPRPAGLAPGTGLGLRNVRHRYELLQAPRPVEVVAEEAVFRVRLPLLEGTR